MHALSEQHRQKTDAAGWYQRLVIVIGLTIALWHPAAATDSRQYESLERIRTTAVEFAREQIAGRADRVEVEANSLDGRLRLAACDQPLAASAAPGSARVGYTAVQVACPGKQPWRLYVRVQVRAYGEVVVASRALPRGNLLAAQDLRLAERNLTELSFDYARDPAWLTGRSLRRSLRAGEVVPLAALSVRHLVENGQQVTLVAGSGALRINMAGTALKDGAKGDRIHVRNQSSQRIVEGTVVAAGTVRVGH